MNKTIKVIQFTDAYYPTVDGVISVVKNYTTQLNKRDVCSIAAPSASRKSNYVDADGFEVVRCKAMPAPEGYRNALSAFDGKFKKEMLAKDVDIIHAHSPFEIGRTAARLAKKKGVPLVATLHTQYHQDFERVLGKRNPLVKFMIRYIMSVFKKADSVWTVSNASKAYLHRYGYKGEIRVIRNATDYVYPENAKELSDKIKKLHNLENQENIFVFVGRMAKYKNLLLLCDALKIVKDNNKDFKMLFVGGGFDLDEIIGYAKNIGIADKCIFTGNVGNRNDLQGYYLASDLLIFPSTFDMASIVQVEASAHKKPAVVVKGSCSAEQIIDNENGFLCEESAESLAQKLIELCSNPQLVKDAGIKAYETLYRTWDMVGQEVANAYREIIEEYNQAYKGPLKRFRRKRFKKR